MSLRLTLVIPMPVAVLSFFTFFATVLKESKVTLLALLTNLMEIVESDFVLMPYLNAFSTNGIKINGAMFKSLKSPSSEKETETLSVKRTF